MSDKKLQPVIFTDTAKCRSCYACVRVCPVKAIRVNENFAEIIPERCIACGNCLTICSNDAIRYRSSKQQVMTFVRSGKKVAAIIDPSIPGEFVDISHYSRFVGMIKQIGFEYVADISFGADIIALKYKELINNSKKKFYITANCPAVVKYIEKYHPDNIASLAPVISPMVATAKITRELYGNDIYIVAIGPCLAAKDEALGFPGLIDAVMTFRELRELFEETGITEKYVNAREFDQPIGYKGSLYPVKRGWLQAVDMDQNLLTSEILSVTGTNDFPDAVRQFITSTDIQRHLDLFSCDGCVMGPGTSKGGKKFIRRSLVIDYANRRLKKSDPVVWKKNIEKFRHLDVSRSFNADDQRIPVPASDALKDVLESLGNHDMGCGACGYASCGDFAVAISQGLARYEMCPSYSIKKIMEVNQNLASTKAALEQSEKLAGMGQLSAGIAHELNNPLGVVIMYCNILLDECPEDSPMRADLELIVTQANRCKRIVGGLLNFARKNQINAEKTDALKLVRDSIASTLIPDNITVKTETKTNNLSALLDYEQMLQVLVNLLKNAVEAMPKGGILMITIGGTEQDIEFKIADTGTGIKPEDMDKIFTPFFTTKEAGQGTGLGLPTTYGIIKMHKGNISVTSNHDPKKGQTGTAFRIVLPRNRLLKSIEST